MPRQLKDELVGSSFQLLVFGTEGFRKPKKINEYQMLLLTTETFMPFMSFMVKQKPLHCKKKHESIDVPITHGVNMKGGLA